MKPRGMDAKKTIATFVFSLIRARSKNKDLARRESIFYILLLASVILSFLALIVIALKDLQSESHSSLVSIGFICIFFTSLYPMSQKGWYKQSAYLFVLLYYVFVTNSAISWGVGAPQGILTYALIIVMAGILVHSTFSFVMTFLISSTVFVLILLQTQGIVPLTEMQNDVVVPLGIGDGVIFSATFLLIALVSWVFNRESEKALHRAQRSEAALRRQRNELEKHVERKTRELRFAQAEKLGQMHRFVELGKLASGFVHDLANSVNIVSVNLSQIKHKKYFINDAKELVTQAQIGTKRLENFLTAARKQINNKDAREQFWVHKEIEQVIEVLGYKAKKAHVRILFNTNRRIKTFGNSTRFHQVMSNLISNAIDAYDNSRTDDRVAHITLQKKDSIITIKIIDFGSGISKKDLPHIFEPLFTTKEDKSGTGIGLSIALDIVKKDFLGMIDAESTPQKGTIFTVEFPQQ